MAKEEKSQTLLKIGLPKGSLQESTFELMRRAGWRISVRGRSYYPVVDDPELELVLIRAQEIPRYVQNGIIDAGFTGWDWIRENRAEVREVANLLYAKAGFRAVRWVLAVPETSPFKKAEDLEGKRVATEVVNLTRDFFSARGVSCEIEFSWGATEVKPPRLVDAIVELTETGSSLRANNLRVIETVLESTTRLIANTSAWEVKEKRDKLENLALLLQGAIAAQNKVGLKMNLRRSDLPEITSLLSSLHSPTISEQSDPEWVAVEVVTDEKKARDLIPRLKRLGAQGIIEYPLNKIIL